MSAWATGTLATNMVTTTSAKTKIRFKRLMFFILKILDCVVVSAVMAFRE
jgi:hypothetical protein